MKTDRVIKFNENTKLNIGDYFRAYKSKYCTLIKDIADNQRNYEDNYGEYYITMVKVDIYNKEGILLAENSIVPINRIVSGALSKYIPNLDYGPTYIGMVNINNHPAEYKIWTDIRDRCYNCKDKLFPYIGGVGTIMCDRWRCFEYFLADFKHIEGYIDYKDNIAYNHYIVDLYDIQKHIHPSNRIYAPGYVKLKPFKESDICKYYNLPFNLNNYPKDLETTTKYINGLLNIKEILYKKQTGFNVVLDLNMADYYYNSKIGYQPLVGMIPYITDNYNNLIKYQSIGLPVLKKDMCVIIKH